MLLHRRWKKPLVFQPQQQQSSVTCLRSVSRAELQPEASSLHPKQSKAAAVHPTAFNVDNWRMETRRAYRGVQFYDKVGPKARPYLATSQHSVSYVGTMGLFRTSFPQKFLSVSRAKLLFACEIHSKRCLIQQHAYISSRRHTSFFKKCNLK